MKRGLRIAQHARRWCNNGRQQLWLRRWHWLAGSCLRRDRRCLHRWLLVDNHGLRCRCALCSLCSLCIQRCLGPPLALNRLSTWILWLSGLTGFSDLLFWLRGTWIFLLGFWTWLLTRLARCSESSGRGRRSRISRGGSTSSTNTNRRCSNAGIGCALLGRVWRRAQAAW